MKKPKKIIIDLNNEGNANEILSNALRVMRIKYSNNIRYVLKPNGFIDKRSEVETLSDFFKVSDYYWLVGCVELFLGDYISFIDGKLEYRDLIQVQKQKIEKTKIYKQLKL